MISVDTKKKELVGDFKNAARNGIRRGGPDGCIMTSSTGIRAKYPYGVYDLAANEGWVSVGIPTIPRSSPSNRSAAGGRDGDQVYPEAQRVAGDCGLRREQRASLAVVEGVPAEVGR